MHLECLGAPFSCPMAFRVLHFGHPETNMFRIRPRGRTTGGGLEILSRTLVTHKASEVLRGRRRHARRQESEKQHDFAEEEACAAAELGARATVGAQRRPHRRLRREQRAVGPTPGPATGSWKGKQDQNQYQDQGHDQYQRQDQRDPRRLLSLASLHRARSWEVRQISPRILLSQK